MYKYHLLPMLDIHFEFTTNQALSQALRRHMVQAEHHTVSNCGYYNACNKGLDLVRGVRRDPL